MKAHPQAGILLPPPPAARYLEFALRPGTAQPAAKSALAAILDGDARIDGTSAVVGLGASLVELLDLHIAGLRVFPILSASGLEIPSTPHALWIWLRGEDRGELVHRTRRIVAALAYAFTVSQITDAFVYDGGRDLTGYEDGTENPKSEAATEAAIVGADASLGPPGSSFAAVQLWQHDLARFSAMDRRQQDFAVGRNRVTNEELADAPPSAHVKRTAQESFDPAAFVVRRSMPWSDSLREGLMFVAFGATLDSFERQLRRMAGLDDGIVDGLFAFTRPLSGSYYWCPPVVGGGIQFETS